MPPRRAPNRGRGRRVGAPPAPPVGVPLQQNEQDWINQGYDSDTDLTGNQLQGRGPLNRIRDTHLFGLERQQPNNPYEPAGISRAYMHPYNAAFPSPEIQGEFQQTYPGHNIGQVQEMARGLFAEHLPVNQGSGSFPNASAIAMGNNAPIYGESHGQVPNHSEPEMLRQLYGARGNAHQYIVDAARRAERGIATVVGTQPPCSTNNPACQGLMSNPDVIPSGSLIIDTIRDAFGSENKAHRYNQEAPAFNKAAYWIQHFNQTGRSPHDLRRIRGEYQKYNPTPDQRYGYLPLSIMGALKENERKRNEEAERRIQGKIDKHNLKLANERSANFKRTNNPWGETQGLIKRLDSTSRASQPMTGGATGNMGGAVGVSMVAPTKGGSFSGRGKSFGRGSGRLIREVQEAPGGVFSSRGKTFGRGAIFAAQQGRDGATGSHSSSSSSSSGSVSSDGSGPSGVFAPSSPLATPARPVAPPQRHREVLDTRLQRAIDRSYKNKNSKDVVSDDGENEKRGGRIIAHKSTRRTPIKKTQKIHQPTSKQAAARTQSYAPQPYKQGGHVAHRTTTSQRAPSRQMSYNDWIARELQTHTTNTHSRSSNRMVSNRSNSSRTITQRSQRSASVAPRGMNVREQILWGLG